MAKELKQIIISMLAKHNTATIATLNTAGKPEAAAVFYVNNCLDLFFLSNPNSRHAGNISGGVDCAITIQKDYNNWQDIKGLQLEGTVVPVDDNVKKALALKAYLKKYSFLNTPLPQGHKLLSALHKSKIYHFVPSIIWVTDNNYSFGKRRELRLDNLRNEYYEY
ncbi:MAG: pyridoxamine 5'-phosphate oxidase family protein [Bacillota bacterium]|nr:pyridoxamine 5'-phosphate oxidase family protein [Bacillota bacterium]